MELGFIACLWGYVLYIFYSCCLDLFMLQCLYYVVIFIVLLSRACSIYTMNDAKFICFLSRDCLPPTSHKKWSENRVK